MTTLRFILIVVTVALSGCVTLRHTLSDGTTVAVDNNAVSVTSGKSTVELQLP